MITRFSLSRPLGELALVAVLALICLGMSAHAGLRAIAANAPVVDAAPARTGFEAEDHFPGAAYFYAVDDDAAPAAGATGTTALPTMTVPANARFDVDDGTVHAARAFSMAAASATDRGRALQCLASAVYYEAASESDDGQRAVAQVVLNRVMHPAFPDTVCGVVYQGSERASGCQFSFACDGATARPPMRAAWDKALRIAGAALDGYVFAPVGLATHYHTYAVTPAWNRQLVMTDAIGAHLFHRWAGYWGTFAAFDQVYRGGEPLPGPHPRAAPDAVAAPATLAAAASDATASPVAPAPAKAASITTAMIQPAYADSGAIKAGAPSADALPESTVLDKWKDSGKPLR
ncbi:cell wall hydrolase [Hephaestia mangrovi]|uniref:cell wall hydrolase n=1 Tax=Hephaestia mangrovi TaxID=2873268 RepID=UPI001CA6BBD8|nr:cell wall hydrolase [Hephaestia mangrovi]MBY8828702.1 cell wall hydrolase [Hephaestia mangrovi]